MTKPAETAYFDIKKQFPGAKFMGGFNNRNIGTTNVKSDHATGNAFDVGGTPKEMSAMAETLRTTMQQRGIKYVIYNGKIASPDKNNGAWRTYQVPKGGSPHKDHVHASFISPSDGMADFRKMEEKSAGYSNYWKLKKEATADPKSYNTASLHIQKAMAAKGVPESWFTPLMELIGRESNWKTNNKNPKSTANGYFQFLNDTRKTYGGSKVNWDDPYQQAIHGIQYVIDRYKTPERALQYWDKHKSY